ncbi:amidohydrolase family protein [Emcibacter sp.]|uniref:amidohydrolase family protein n=1 Tax=Emcibacter sp. TaxID=1979954 RepID=UPI002AA64D7F|nr:amidohydrolase family protein [Emcibacter sp.]
MRKLLKSTAVAVSLSLLPFVAGAETVAITGGKVMTMGKSGVIENGTVLIENGKIKQVGSDVKIPSDARMVDAAGKVVVPGFMNSHSQLGLTEISLTDDSNNHSAREAPFSAAFDVRYGYNPESMEIANNRVEGLTRAVSAPSGSGHLFSGSGAIVSLASLPNMTKGPLFAHLDDGGNEGVAWNRMRIILDQVKAYARDRSDVMEGEGRSGFLLTLEDMDALIPVVRGERKLALVLERAADIRQAIALKEEYDLDLILLDVPEAWKVAKELAAADIPVVIDAQSDLPYQFTSIGSTLSNAARLEKAGVTFAISGLGETHRAYLINQWAGLAVAHGLSYEGGLRAITVNPAKIFGIDDSYGTLEKGMDADVVVWDGDPLEVTSNPEHIFVRGVEYPRVSRKTMLRDRYLKLDTDMPHAYQ